MHCYQTLNNSSFTYTFSLQPVSISEMKGATTVFVGNITDKATDTLMKQILLVILLHSLNGYCIVFNKSLPSLVTHTHTHIHTS